MSNRYTFPDIESVTVIPETAKALVVRLRDGFADYAEEDMDGYEEDLKSVEDQLREAFPGIKTIVVIGLDVEPLREETPNE